MLNYNQTFFVKPTGDILTSHLYEHIVLEKLAGYLSSHGVGKYLSLVGDLSGQTFNKLILFNSDYFNKLAADLTSQFFDQTITVDQDIINQELACIAAEDGCLYDVTDLDQLLVDLNNLASLGFINLIDLPGSFYQPMTTPKQPQTIRRTFAPSEFIRLTIHLGIKQPTLADRITLETAMYFLADVVDLALQDLGGYRRKSLHPFVTDAHETNQLTLCYDSAISKHVANQQLVNNIKRALKEVDFTNYKTTIQSYQRKLCHWYGSSRHIEQYGVTGVLTSPAQLRKLVTYDNLVASWSKITVSAQRRSANEYYSDPGLTQLER